MDDRWSSWFLLWVSSTTNSETATPRGRCRTRAWHLLTALGIQFCFGTLQCGGARKSWERVRRRVMTTGEEALDSWHVDNTLYRRTEAAVTPGIRLLFIPRRKSKRHQKRTFETSNFLSHDELRYCEEHYQKDWNNIPDDLLKQRLRGCLA